MPFWEKYNLQVDNCMENVTNKWITVTYKFRTASYKCSDVNYKREMDNYKKLNIKLQVQKSCNFRQPVTCW